MSYPAAKGVARVAPDGEPLPLSAVGRLCGTTPPYKLPDTFTPMNTSRIAQRNASPAFPASYPLPSRAPATVEHHLMSGGGIGGGTSWAAVQWSSGVACQMRSLAYSAAAHVTVRPQSPSSSGARPTVPIILLAAPPSSARLGADCPRFGRLVIVAAAVYSVPRPRGGGAPRRQAHRSRPPSSSSARAPWRMKWLGGSGNVRAPMPTLKRDVGPRNNACHVHAGAQRLVTSRSPTSPGGSRGVTSSAGASDVSDGHDFSTTMATPISDITTVITTIIAAAALMLPVPSVAAPTAAVAAITVSSHGLRTSVQAGAVVIVAALVDIIVCPLPAATVITIGSHHPAIRTTTIHGATIFTTAMLRTHLVTPSSLLLALPWASGRPYSSLIISWPVPRSSGSSPGVLVARVACGIVMKVVRTVPPTGGGVNGTSGGLQDERNAAAAERTTCEGLTSPPAHDANDAASGIGVKLLFLTMSPSSLLRNDGITITAMRSVSISSGRRGSSGQPRRTDRTSTGSLAPPTTAGLRRAAWRHHCRSAAGALAPSPVSLPRVATASLLTSSMPPQLGEHTVTGRAG